MKIKELEAGLREMGVQWRWDELQTAQGEKPDEVPASVWTAFEPLIREGVVQSGVRAGMGVALQYRFTYTGDDGLKRYRVLIHADVDPVQEGQP